MSALREACGMVSVPSDYAIVLNIGNCAIVALPNARLAARIGRNHYPPERFENELHFVQTARPYGLPVLEPARAIPPSVIVTASGPVTFWPLLQHYQGAFDWAWLGSVLRRLHEIPLAGLADVKSDPIRAIHERITRYANAPGAREEYVEVLLSACDLARSDLASLHSVLGVGVLHGDAGPGNVLLDQSTPLLADFDLSGIGLKEWDLMVPAVLYRRFGLGRKDLQCFLRSYGFDVTQWDGFEPMVRTRELLDISFAVSLAPMNELVRRELDVRMRALLDAVDRTPWASLRSVFSRES